MTIEEKVGKDWYELIENALMTDSFRRLGKYIAERRKLTEVYPNSEDVFKAFKLTKPETVKVIMLGQDPYNNWSAWSDRPVADGLAFSTHENDKTPVSLLKIHKAIEEDCYEGLNLSSHNDLSYLAHQGVLLLNSSLTVEKNSPLSHSNKGWKEFVTECLIKLVQLGNPLVGIAFGASARKIMEEVGIWSNKYQKFIYVEHPAKSAYEGRDWDHKGCFREVNDFLRKETNRIIEW